MKIRAALLAGAVALVAPAAAQAEPFAGLTADGKLLRVDTATPGKVDGLVPISGLGTDVLVGLDARPKTGALVGVGKSGFLYTISPVTGAATRGAQLVKADATGAIVQPPTPVTLAGDAFGVDFNPVPDRLRLVSDAGENLRINVETGGTITDGALNSSAGPFRVVGAGYTNSAFSATQPTSTALYDVDAGGDRLLLQTPPNAGTLVPIGSFGLPVDDRSDLDVSGATGLAYLVAGDALSTVSLTTGAASPIGAFGAAPAVVDGTVLPVGTPPVSCLADVSGASQDGPVTSVLNIVGTQVARLSLNGAQPVKSISCTLAGAGL